MTGKHRPFLKEEDLEHLVRLVLSEVKIEKNRLLPVESLIEQVLEKPVDVDMDQVSMYDLVSLEILDYQIEEDAILKKNNDIFSLNGFVLPAFAVYSLASPRLKIKISLKNEFKYWFSPELPEALAERLRYNKDNERDIRKIFEKSGILDKTRTFNLETQFFGLLKQETRERIIAAQEIFGSNLYLVSRAVWTLEFSKKRQIIHQNKPTRSDAYVSNGLVIGIKENLCFLIDDFITDPLLKEYL